MHATTASMPPAADRRTQTVLDYQRTMKQFLAMQQRLMLAQLQSRHRAGGQVNGQPHVAPTAALEGTAAQTTHHPSPSPVPATAQIEHTHVAPPTSVPSKPAASPLPASATQSVPPAPSRQPAPVKQHAVQASKPAVSAAAVSAAIGAAVLDRPKPQAARRSPLPFIETVLIHEPGTRLVAECELDVRRHRFLLDHTFIGRALSVADPDLYALPVMPLAMSLEILAEAAARLCPELRVVAMDNVRTQRWLAFESDNRRVRVEARPVDETHVHVALSEADREGFSAIIAEGTVELADFELELGAARLPDTATDPAPWAKDLYDWILFHGPAFQGIDSIDAYLPTGIRATVHEPSPQQLFAPGLPNELVLPAALVDVASQVPGMIYGKWKPTDPEVYMVFPNSIGRLEFAEDRGAGPLTAVATMRRDGQHLHSDVELTTADGRVVLRMTDRVCQVVDFPTGLHHYSKASTEIACSQDITGTFAGIPHIDDCRVCETLTAGSPILLNRLWSQVVARLILGREERAAFAGQKLSPAAAAYWLAGRMAAKDAVRLATQTTNPGQKLCMADVKIAANGDGRPHADVPGVKVAPKVSIAHKEFKALALAAPDHLAGVGIDIEALSTMDPGLVADSFTKAELALLAAAATATSEPVDNWYLSAWSAKEALGKALGRGVLGGPRAVEVRDVDAASGLLRLALRGPMAEAFPKLVRDERGEITLPAWRRLHGPYCVALCLLESLPEH